MPEITDFASFMHVLGEPDERATEVRKPRHVPHPTGANDLPVQASKDELAGSGYEAPLLQTAVDRSIVTPSRGSSDNAAGPEPSGRLIPVQAQLLQATPTFLKALQVAVAALTTAEAIQFLTELRQRVQSETSRTREAIASEIAAIDEEIHALEYRGQLKHNTLSLLSRAEPALKQGLNQDPGQPKLEIHHTVPYRDYKVERARKILQKWGFSIHDPADAAIVPGSYHRGEMVHGMPDGGYDAIIDEEMKKADTDAELAARERGREAGRAVILEKLRQLSDWVVANSHDPRAIALEKLLRSIERPLPRPDLTNVLSWKGYGR
ncbi:hypothetical protein NFI95_09565 [Acetobacteraceae bacterium KSS8]|uniref:Uncharacterized protein n=1 Tax=Endosaccharibacter trunci TaxID=2812733 RepID=A0ABT1W747_9PROT|nr:hypothetical protein [Acetobacteraceae bacterium KSS8]